MGFFDTWNVSGITTDSAKSSEPFYLLAQAIDDSGQDDIPIELLLKTAQVMLKKEKSFELFFYKSIKAEKTDAIQFLVALSSYIMGKDGMFWDWQTVRHHSQGLYGSMTESPNEFVQYNLKFINQVKLELDEFVKNHS